MKFNALLLASVAPIALLTACGGDLSINEFPRIEVSVGGESLDDTGGSIAFDAAVLQNVEDKVVRIVNPGNEDLLVTDIAWKKDPDTGLTLRNPYISMVLPDGQTFPISVPAEDSFGFQFTIRYEPPIGKPLDVFDSSFLVISSNARKAGDTADVGDVEVEFRMEQDFADPIAIPDKYIFQNATTSKPETQSFIITNNPDTATAPFTILDIVLETPSDEFTLSNLPNSGTVVVEPNSPEVDKKEVSFDVTYAPVDEGSDTNRILVTTDVGKTLEIELGSNLIQGNFSLNYSCALQFDFSTLSQCNPEESCGCSRRVIVISEGPGPITIDEPRIEPVEARQVFEWKAFKPQTSPETPQEEVTDNFPRALLSGSLEFELIYSPDDFANAPNGEFIIPIATPNNQEVTIPVFAGDPKPILELAPKNKLLSVGADVAGGETGTRHAVIYNHGNGDLIIKDVVVQDSFGGTPDVFSVGNAPAPDTAIPPGSLFVLDVDWDVAGLKAGDTEVSEGLIITYIDGLTGEATDTTVGLSLADRADSVLPTANPGTAADYAGAVVGEPVSLNGSGSDAGSYSFGDPNNCNCFYWYLVDKPDGSQARLNAESGQTTEFTPDAPGDYTVEMVVYASGTNADGESVFVFSDAATVTISVAAP